MAEGLDVSRRTAQRRLSALDEEGRIERTDVGARGAVWWTVEDAPGAPAAPRRRLVGELDPAAAATLPDPRVLTRNVDEFERVDAIDVEPY